MKTLEYKGYFASLEFDLDDDLICGRVIGIRDVIGFQGETIKKAIEDFHSVIDFYLEGFNTSGKTPPVSLPLNRIVEDKLANGGKWLGAARLWMQHNVNRGDTLEWSSNEVVHIPFNNLEDLAQTVAVAAILAERTNP